MRNPVRTIKLAAPTAVLLVTMMYLLVNVAYYAVVDKEDILGSGRIAAALFFGKLWGSKAERVGTRPFENVCIHTSMILRTAGQCHHCVFNDGQRLGRLVHSF